MARQDLSDASPLIGLALVDGLPWLGRLFGSVLVPQEVWAEVVARGFLVRRRCTRRKPQAGLKWRNPHPRTRLCQTLTSVKPPASGWPLADRTLRCC